MKPLVSVFITKLMLLIGFWILHMPLVNVGSIRLNYRCLKPYPNYIGVNLNLAPPHNSGFQIINYILHNKTNKVSCFYDLNYTFLLM
jgi:hypothetical protein